MTTVLLVDDHPLVRSGLNTLISTTDDLEIIGEAGAVSRQSRWPATSTLT